MVLAVASNNEHKITEVRHALAPDFRILTLQELGCHEELAETGTTLEANAHQKAAYVFNNYHTPCFADDTGLEVAALNNAPGVYSARYAGPQRNNEENIQLLLANLQGVSNRTAQFRTVICYITPQQTTYFEGIIKGNITLEKRGSMGFGYDSVFVPEGHTKTFAEMTLPEKNSMSHRALAVAKLIQHLKKT